MADSLQVLDNGWIKTDAGLFVPPTDELPYKGSYDNSADGLTITIGSDGVVRQVKTGTHLKFDEESGVAWWPAYASGFDDLLMRALTRGHMANAGRTPVVISMLSTLVAKRQAMAGTWLVTATGKKSPVKAALDLISRADDSDVGPTIFAQNVIGAVDVDNRGAIISQVPIGIIPIDEWEDYGMMIEPIKNPKAARGRKQTAFVLRMTTEGFRENRGLWSVDGLTCLPTGNKDYPIWIRKYSPQRKTTVWVLIHRDFAFQLLQRNGGRSSQFPGFGQSGTWRFSPYAVKHMILDRMDYEHLFAQPMRGIVWASGLDNPMQLSDTIKSWQKEKSDADLKFYPGVIFGGSVNKDAQIQLLPWTQPPPGYSPSTWQDEMISNLASSFHMNETHLRLKLGEGALTQSGVAESLEAETSISWMRSILETIYSRVSPPRVTITVVWQSDRTVRYQIESFRELSLGISRLQKQFPGADAQDDPVFTRPEIRAMITQTIGIDIPEEVNDEDTDSRTSGDKSASIGERFNRRRQFKPLLSLNVPNDMKYAVGNTVSFRDGRIATITGWSGNNDWVWVTSGKHESLVSAKNISLLQFITPPFPSHLDGNDHDEDTHHQAVPASHPPDSDWQVRPFFRKGHRVYQHGSTTPMTIVGDVYDGDTRIILTKYDWDGPEIEPRPFGCYQLHQQFEVSGEPLEPVAEWEITDDDVASAQTLWAALAVGTYGDLFADWRWNEDDRVWVNDVGQSLTQREMILARDNFADDSGVFFNWLPDEDEDDPDEEDISLTALLLFGFITLNEWERRMRQELTRTHVAQWLAASGGDPFFNDIFREELANRLVAQFGFLSVFSREIASNTLSDAEISARAALYYHQSVASYEEGHNRAYGFRLPVYPGDGTSVCRTNDRCFWEYSIDGDVVMVNWIRTAAESCRTCVTRSGCPTVEYDILTGELRNTDCYIRA